MTDDQIDAVLRRLDVGYKPDRAFIDRSLATLARRKRALPRRNWLLRRLDGMSAAWPEVMRPAAREAVLLALMMMLLLALVAGALLVGGLTARRPAGNGPLIVARAGQLDAVDPETGRGRSVLAAGERVFQVTRSPDGRAVAFWTTEAEGDRLEVIAVDGSERRSLGDDLPALRNGGCIDVWSPDSRSVASEVTVGGRARIAAFDAGSGEAAFVTPEGIVAHCPLWSPDGVWLSFAQDWPGGRQTLAVIRRDGTETRTVAELRGERVSGPASWSADGAWIYFDAESQGTLRKRVYRTELRRGLVEPLTGAGANAAAPALSPDMTLMSFITVRSTSAYDLYVSNPDGSDPRHVLANASNHGWSTDSRYLLTEWRPPTTRAPGGLVVVRPDGSDLRVVVPFDEACRKGTRTCLDGAAWGQPRP